MASFKTLAKAGEHTPDRFLEYEHKNLYDIADKDVYVEDFELFESKNTTKYNNDNLEGVIILMKLVETQEEFTVVTHAKSIVRVFKNIANRGVSKDILSNEWVQFHLGETLVNGNKYPQWQII